MIPYVASFGVRLLVVLRFGPHDYFVLLHLRQVEGGLIRQWFELFRQLAEFYLPLLLGFGVA